MLHYLFTPSMNGSLTPPYCNAAVTSYSWPDQNRQHNCGSDTRLHFLPKLWPKQGHFLNSLSAVFCRILKEQGSLELVWWFYETILLKIPLLCSCHQCDFAVK